MLRTRLAAGTAALCMALVGAAAFSDLTAPDAGGANLEAEPADSADLGRMIEAQSIKAKEARNERAAALFQRAVDSTETASDLRKAAAELERRQRAADAKAAEEASAKKAAEVKASSAERVAAKAAAKAELAEELASERDETSPPTTEAPADAGPPPTTDGGPTEAEQAAAAESAAAGRAEAAHQAAAAEEAAKKATEAKAWMEAAQAHNDEASAPIPEPWASLAQCESTGNWAINTGNGYYGGLQFNLGTWRSYGGQGMPHQNTPAQQIEIAKRVQAKQGWGAWPACSRKLGLR